MCTCESLAGSVGSPGVRCVGRKACSRSVGVKWTWVRPCKRNADRMRGVRSVLSDASVHRKIQSTLYVDRWRPRTPDSLAASGQSPCVNGDHAHRLRFHSSGDSLGGCGFDAAADREKRNRLWRQELGALNRTPPKKMPRQVSQRTKKKTTKRHGGDDRRRSCRDRKAKGARNQSLFKSRVLLCIQLLQTRTLAGRRPVAAATTM